MRDTFVSSAEVGGSGLSEPELPWCGRLLCVRGQSASAYHNDALPSASFHEPGKRERGCRAPSGKGLASDAPKPTPTLLGRFSSPSEALLPQHRTVELASVSPHVCVAPAYTRANGTAPPAAPAQYRSGMKASCNCCASQPHCANAAAGRARVPSVGANSWPNWLLPQHLTVRAAVPPYPSATRPQQC
jgi:hypothetical protein